MKKYFILLIYIVFLLTLFGCTPATITVDESSKKEIVCLKKGDILEIILGTNPSTGYEWSVVNIDSTKLKIVSESYIANQVNRAVVGGGGNKIYLFKTISKGNTAIELIYFRSFEKEIPPKKKFHINLNIR